MVHISTPPRVLEALKLFLFAYQRENAADFSDLAAAMQPHAEHPMVSPGGDWTYTPSYDEATLITWPWPMIS